MDKARLDSLQESEETMNEMRNVYEREKLMLMEENKKLQVGVSFIRYFIFLFFSEIQINSSANSN